MGIKADRKSASYDVEELLALRGTAPATVALEKFRDEDAVKEHVLRPSVSSAFPLSTRYHQHSLHSADQNLFGRSHRGVIHSTPQQEAPAQNHSPTPSMKRGKAEQLLKEHGSPPGLRVTAGGRIIPDNLSPLPSPQILNSKLVGADGTVENSFGPAIQLLHTNNFPVSHNLPEGAVAFDVTGRLCQIVSGQMYPLPVLNGTHSLYVPASNFSQFSSLPFQPPLPRTPIQQWPQHTVANRLRSNEVPSPAGDKITYRTGRSERNVAEEIRIREEEKAHFSHQLKELDKYEVINRGAMTSIAHQALIEKRRFLVLSINDVRLSLKSLYAYQAQQRTMQGERATSQSSSGPARLASNHQVKASLHDFISCQADFEAPLQPVLTNARFTRHLGTVNHGAAFTSQANVLLRENAISQLRAAASFDSGSSRTVRGNIDPDISTAHDPYASDVPSKFFPAGRPSHAVEIKNPDSQATLRRKSPLDPTSPVYEPLAKVASGPAIPLPSDNDHAFPSPVPTPIPEAEIERRIQNDFPWLNEMQDTPNPLKIKSKSENNLRGHNASMTSVSTADFFPVNTKEYSTRRQDHTNESVLPTATKDDVSRATCVSHDPITPQKDWHQSPWNVEGSTPNTEGTHRPAAPPTTPADLRLSSWTQACGSQIQVAQRASMESSPHGAIGEERALRRVRSKASFQMLSSPIAGRSTAYAEGYQAGYARMAINHGTKPEDFLNGYCTGLRESNPPANDVSTFCSQTGSRLADVGSSSQTGHVEEVPVRYVGAVPANQSLSYEISHNGPSYIGGPSPSAIEMPTSPRSELGGAQMPSGNSVRRNDTTLSEPTHTSAGDRSEPKIQVHPISSLLTPLSRPISGNQLTYHTATGRVTLDGEGGKSLDRTVRQAKSGAICEYPEVNGRIRHSGRDRALPPQSFTSVCRPVMQALLPANTGFSYDGKSKPRDDLLPQLDGAADDAPRIPHARNIKTSPLATQGDRRTPKERLFRSSVSNCRPDGSRRPIEEAADRATGSSPTKRLEQLANKYRRRSTDRRTGDRADNGKPKTIQTSNPEEDEDPAKMNFEQKKAWRSKWKKRFERVKTEEMDEIRAYKRSNPIPEDGRE